MTMLKRNSSFCADAAPVCIIMGPWPGDIWGDIWGDIFGEDDSDDDD